MHEILVKEYSVGKKKIVYEESKEECSDVDYVLKKIKEKGMKNSGRFTQYCIYDFGVYKLHWKSGIGQIEDDITYLSKWEIDLICRNTKEFFKERIRKEMCEDCEEEAVQE